jgi:hypothetical protein
LIVLLLALLIVAILAQTALKRYGLLSSADAPDARARAPAMAAPAEIDATAPVSAPRNAIERARSLQEDVRQQAEDAGKKIDDETK